MIYVDNYFIEEVGSEASATVEKVVSEDIGIMDCLNETAIQQYRKLHRYLPNFSHVEPI